MANSMQAGVVASVAMLTVASIGGADAVQWRVEDGGNGHWYARTSESLVFPQMRSACEAKGGHLATLATQAEWAWVRSALPVSGHFTGGYQDRQDSDYAEPGGGWKWVTGEPFVLDLDYMGVDDCPGGTPKLCGCGPSGAQDVLFYTGCCNNILDDIGDGIVQNCDSAARHGIIEWSADCDGNGLVDYGEIRAGLVADANANNIPDACECGSFPGFPDCCPGDVVLSGEVNGVDLAAVLGAWGTDGGKFPRADIDGSGVVDGADLTVVLNDWGLCE